MLQKNNKTNKQNAVHILHSEIHQENYSEQIQAQQVKLLRTEHSWQLFH